MRKELVEAFNGKEVTALAISKTTNLFFVVLA